MGDLWLKGFPGGISVLMGKRAAERLVSQKGIKAPAVWLQVCYQQYGSVTLVL